MCQAQYKALTYIVSFNLHKNSTPTPTLEILLLTPCFRWRNWSLKSLYNFPKATQFINGRAMIQTQSGLTPRLRFFCLLAATVSLPWESQKAMALPGLIHGLEIYQVHLQVLSRLWSEIAGQSFKNLGLPLQNNWQLLSFFGKNLLESQKLLCYGHSLPKSVF